MKIQKVKQSQIKRYKSEFEFTQIILFPEYTPNFDENKGYSAQYSKYYVCSDFTPEQWTKFCNSAKASYSLGLGDSYFQIALHAAKIKYIKHDNGIDEHHAKNLVYQIPSIIKIKHSNYGKI